MANFIEKCYNLKEFSKEGSLLDENMKILQIASGSKGNATFIEQEGTAVILDAGISKKRITEALENANLSFDHIKAILLTHEHVDHTAGLIPLFNATNALIYTTRGTYLGLSKKIKEKIPEGSFRFIDRNLTFQIGSLMIQSVELSHDALDPIGFVFSNGSSRLVYVTDTGYVKQSLYETLRNANMYIWESNHDPEILMQSDRPYETKKRILSDEGHLSNQDSAYILANLIGPNTKTIVYAHISEECNLNQIIKLTSSRVFNDLGIDTSDIEFYYASQIPLKEIEI